MLVKLGLLRLRSTGPRQNPNSQRLMVEMGLGSEHLARPMPTLQQSQNLLVKLGFLESQSTVPRQNPNSRCLLLKSLVGSSWSRTIGTTNAEGTAVVQSVGEVRLLGTTSDSESDLSESSDEESSDVVEPGCARSSGTTSAVVTSAAKSVDEDRLLEIEKYRATQSAVP